MRTDTRSLKKLSTDWILNYNMGHLKGLKFTPEQLLKRRNSIQWNIEHGINSDPEVIAKGLTNIEYLEAKLPHRQPSQRPFTQTHLEHMWMNKDLIAATENYKEMEKDRRGFKDEPKEFNSSLGTKPLTQSKEDLNLDEEAL